VNWANWRNTRATVASASAASGVSIRVVSSDGLNSTSIEASIAADASAPRNAPCNNNPYRGRSTDAHASGSFMAVRKTRCIEQSACVRRVDGQSAQ